MKNNSQGQLIFRFYLFFWLILAGSNTCAEARLTAVYSKTGELGATLSNFRDFPRLDTLVEVDIPEYIAKKPATLKVYPSGTTLNPNKVLIQLDVKCPFKGGFSKEVISVVMETYTLQENGKFAVHKRVAKITEDQNVCRFECPSFIPTSALDRGTDRFYFKIRPLFKGDLHEKVEPRKTTLTWYIPRPQIALFKRGLTVLRSRVASNRHFLALGNKHDKPEETRLSYWIGQKTVGEQATDSAPFPYSKSCLSIIKNEGNSLKELHSQSWKLEGKHLAIGCVYNPARYVNLGCDYKKGILKECHRLGMTVPFVMELNVRKGGEDQDEQEITHKGEERYLLEQKERVLLVDVDTGEDIIYARMLCFSAMKPAEEISASFKCHEGAWEMAAYPFGADTHATSMKLTIRASDRSLPPKDGHTTKPQSFSAEPWPGLQGFIIYHHRLTARTDPEHAACIYAKAGGVATTLLMHACPVKTGNLNKTADYEEFVIHPIYRMQVSVVSAEKEKNTTSNLAQPFMHVQINPETNTCYDITVNRFALSMVGKGLMSLESRAATNQQEVASSIGSPEQVTSTASNNAIFEDDFTLAAKQGKLSLKIKGIPEDFQGGVEVSCELTSETDKTIDWVTIGTCPQKQVKANDATVVLMNTQELLMQSHGEQVVLRVILKKRSNT